MICSRLCQNTSVIHGIFRRLSLNGDNLRITSFPDNFTNITPPGKKLLGPENSLVCSKHARSITLGNQLNTKNLREMSTSKASTSSGNTNIKTNRLALEKSPYLLQHATNPVDWYPWGREAFETAQKENKLIFLSVGYSTCHWCHVMEKESFENDSVALIMNQHFINIKVDREERPDVDKLYMSFIQATVGGGGWPMSVFLTPNLEPLAGGTYFPPEDRYGRPGFKSVLKNIADMWKNKQGAVESSGKYSLEVLKKVNLGEKAITEQIKVPNENVWKKCLQQLSRSYDDNFGGFSSAPKFPQPTNFNFLFHMYSRDKHSDQGLKCLDMCLTTLKKMAYGGIYDHVNSGFARYSVDAKWHVPHFEKMLYDQGQLVVSYCDAFVVTKDEFFSDVVHDILKYVSRDLSHELGGFYGAEDADSYPFEGAPHKKEGAFCVWDFTDLEDLLHENNFDIFCHHYNVKPEGNVSANQDPHGELINKNILTCFGSYEETAQKFDKSTEEIKDILRKCHEILYARRQERPKPHVDTKIVTSWNGLMISGFAKAGFALKEQRYINRAILAANFIRKFLYNEEERSLLRCCYRGEKDRISQIPEPIQGFLDDYAFLIRGLLDLYEASLDADWLQWAEALQEQQDRRFWDATGSGYFTSPEGDESILIRGKEDQDGAEPCGNSVSVHNLLRLSAYLDRQDLRSKAGRTLTRFSERLQNIPVALPEMASALLLYHNSPTQVFIAGETGDNNTEALLDVVRSHFIPGRILALADGPSGRSGILYRRHESLSRLRPVAGKPAAYVCRNFACSLPVTDPGELADNLDSADKRPDDNPDLKKVFYESSSAADGSGSDTTDDGLNKS